MLQKEYMKMYYKKYERVYQVGIVVTDLCEQKESSKKIDELPNA